MIALKIGLALAVGLLGCRDLSRFSSHGDGFEGSIAAGDFVRAGLEPSTRMCLVIDTEHLQDAPGFLTTTDGKFSKTPLRPIPQVWHDPLSTLSFGEGRIQNLVYAATPAGDTDLLVVISLMQTNTIEVRLLRGAPPSDARTPNTAMFGIFNLQRRDEPCGS